MIARLHITEPRRLALSRWADWLAAAVAAALPWSTSATGILLAAWLLVLLPTLDWSMVRQELRRPAAGLPVALFVLGVIGMAWAFDVPMKERLEGVTSFVRLLVIPLLFVQFRNSPRGQYVLMTLFVSCVALLIASYVTFHWPSLRPTQPGQPVKNYISQSMFFMLCTFALLHLSWLQPTRLRTLMYLVGAGAFIADIFFVATSRTTVMVFPVLLLVWAYRQFGAKGTSIAAAAAVLAGLAFWTSSEYFRGRVMNAVSEVQSYEATDEPTSSGARLEFWKKSLRFVGSAPVFGHGTGSIHHEFEKAAYGSFGSASAIPSYNPHNQTFVIAIQLGVVGALVLWTMWIAHLMLFRGGGTIALFGLLVVLQNIGGSLVNSFLFDFTEGWFYVFAVGVLGGMIVRERSNENNAKDWLSSGSRVR